MRFSSRRAFLMGRRSSKTPWEAFCKRMQRSVSGDFLDYGFYDGAGSARLTPGDAADMHRARALCAEHGIVLALDGINQAASQSHQSVLWIELGRQLTQCQRLPGDDTKWFVQPGCTLGELNAVCDLGSPTKVVSDMARLLGYGIGRGPARLVPCVGGTKRRSVHTYTLLHRPPKALQLNLNLE